MSQEVKKKAFVDTVYDLLCSIKLSIFVLLALAVTSIIGTVVEQGEEAAHYLEHYGSGMGGLINLLNLGDMYHAWWFQVLLALLMVNITFCSVKRLPSAIKLMKDKDPLFDQGGRTVAIHERWQKTLPGRDQAQVFEKAAEIMGKKARLVGKAEADGVLYAMGSRGAFTRMGVYVTHFSLFLFTLGAIVGLMTGFKGYVNIREGETAKEVYDRSAKQMKPIDFAVRCDDFDVTYYPGTMRVKGYESVLTVIDGGREVLTKKIVVNDPLIYKGYYFYQSSYGKSGLKGAVLTVAGPDRNILAANVVLNGGTPTPLPDGTAIMIKDVWQDPQDSNAPSGLVLGISRSGMSQGSGRAFEAMYGRSWWPVGDYQVKLDRITWSEYTGLQIARDPGVPIVWAGCILITIGLMVSFFISHRRVWVKVWREDNKTQIMVAGNASRNRISFEHWFNDLCEELQEAFEKKTQ